MFKKFMVTIIIGVMISNLVVAEENVKKTGVISMARIGMELGNALPEFVFTGLDGKKNNIKDFRGKIVMLNFWATWCPPCKGEMPSMQKLWDKNKDLPFVILAISVDQGPTKLVQDFIASSKYTFPVFHDVDGALSEKFRITSIPTTYILDERGIIISKKVGAEDWAKLNVKALLKK